MSDRAERRNDYLNISERTARVETKVDTALGELGLLRPIVHKMVSEITSLVMLGEQQREDHKAMMAQVGHFADGLAQHDIRDDNRFEAVGVRLNAVEREIGTLHGRHDHERTGADRRLLIVIAIIGFIGALIGGLAASLPMLMAGRG